MRVRHTVYSTCSYMRDVHVHSSKHRQRIDALTPMTIATTMTHPSVRARAATVSRRRTTESPSFIPPRPAPPVIPTTALSRWYNTVRHLKYTCTGIMHVHVHKRSNVNLYTWRVYLKLERNPQKKNIKNIPLNVSLLKLQHSTCPVAEITLGDRQIQLRLTDTV